MSSRRRGLAAITTATTVAFVAFTPTAAGADQTLAVETTPVTITEVVSSGNTEIPLRFRATADQAGVVLTLRHSRIGFGGDEEFENCVPSNHDPDEVLCIWPELKFEASQIYRISPQTPLTFVAPEGSPGPVDLCNGYADCSYRAETIGADDAAKMLSDLGGSTGGNQLQLVEGDSDPDDAWQTGSSHIGFITKENLTDLSAVGKNLTGKIGDTMDLELIVRNDTDIVWYSPHRDGANTLTVEIPSGVRVTQTPEDCQTQDDRVFHCSRFEFGYQGIFYWHFPVEITGDGPFVDGKITVNTAPGDDSWYDTDLDPNQSNNSAVISLNAADTATPPGQLPRTGTSLGVPIAGGAAAILLGMWGLVLTRGRRTDKGEVPTR